MRKAKTGGERRFCANQPICVAKTCSWDIRCRKESRRILCENLKVYTSMKSITITVSRIGIQRLLLMWYPSIRQYSVGINVSSKINEQ